MSEIHEREYDLFLSEQTVLLHGNRHLGNVTPKYEDGWETNIARALGVLSTYTTADHLVTMTPGESLYVDLDCVEAADAYPTNALITTDPKKIILARPADCGEIALRGFSDKEGANLIALVHASSRIVDEGNHISVLEYLRDRHGIAPNTLVAHMSPSAKKDSYKFPDIRAEQKVAEAWEGFVEEDAEGFWHVGFHERTVRDLIAFGIPEDQIKDNSIDTITDQNYFSYYRHHSLGGAKRGEQFGGNGLFFAMRGGASDVNLAA